MTRSTRAQAISRPAIRLQRLFLKPRFLGEYDYASGNTRQNLNKVNTFDQQYPSNHNAFGLTDLFGFQNIEEERMNLDLTPAKHVTLLIQQEWLQVASRFDNIYSGSAGTVIAAPTAGLLSGDIGREFDASGKVGDPRLSGDERGCRAFFSGNGDAGERAWRSADACLFWIDLSFQI